MTTVTRIPVTGVTPDTPAVSSPMGTHLRRRAMRYATIGTTLGLLAALCLVGGGLGGSEDDAVTNVADRPALTLTSPVPGAAGAEDTALDLADCVPGGRHRPGRALPR